MRISPVLFGLLLTTALVCAQEPGAPPEYTIHAQTRVVLTDVTVTDRNGNPVHGLKASDFHIFDNHQAQKLASFEEHTPSPTGAINASATAGVFSNDYIQHLPPVVNVLLLDTAWMPIEIQMELNYELGLFLERFAGDQPLAIYLRRGDDTVLLQDFTTDRELLTAAVHQAIPWLHALGTDYRGVDGAVRTLHEVALSLSSIPARKNLLWFSSGFAVPMVQGLALAPSTEELRPFYDELEAERISLYPIDARGLITSVSAVDTAQHTASSAFAEATGGRVAYKGNDIAGAALDAIDNDRNFYTLTYTPAGLKDDNKWHRIEVKVDHAADGQSYTLSYRRGYFADGFERPSPGADTERAKTRTRLMANGSTLKMERLTRAPIVFEASVQPDDSPTGSSATGARIGRAATRRHDEPISVTYSIPASALQMQEVDGKTQAVIGAVAVIVTREGTVVTRQAGRFVVTVNPAALARHPDAKLHIEQKLDAAKGYTFLALTVWDLLTYRQGHIQVPLQVPMVEGAGSRQ